MAPPGGAGLSAFIQQSSLPHEVQFAIATWRGLGYGWRLCHRYLVLPSDYTTTFTFTIYICIWMAMHAEGGREGDSYIIV